MVFITLNRRQNFRNLISMIEGENKRNRYTQREREREL